MGLDITTINGHASWPYGGFDRFRRALAKREGIRLDAMEGFCASGGSWQAIESPLKSLLNHSDCDGELSVDECRTIVGPLLTAIMELWQPDDYDWMMGTNLVRCMNDCISAGTPLEFH